MPSHRIGDKQNPISLHSGVYAAGRQCASKQKTTKLFRCKIMPCIDQDPYNGLRWYKCRHDQAGECLACIFFPDGCWHRIAIVRSSGQNGFAETVTSVTAAKCIPYQLQVISPKRGCRSKGAKNDFSLTRSKTRTPPPHPAVQTSENNLSI